jgi:hypothetical protein
MKTNKSQNDLSKVRYFNLISNHKILLNKMTSMLITENLKTIS